MIFVLILFLYKSFVKSTGYFCDAIIWYEYYVEQSETNEKFFWIIQLAIYLYKIFKLWVVIFVLDLIQNILLILSIIIFIFYREFLSWNLIRNLFQKFSTNYKLPKFGIKFLNSCWRHKFCVRFNIKYCQL